MPQINRTFIELHLSVREFLLCKHEETIASSRTKLASSDYTRTSNVQSERYTIVRSVNNFETT